MPNCPSLLASHATEAAGLPHTSAVVPDDTSTPFCSRVMPVRRMSTAPIGIIRPPSINRAEEPLSAMVSGSLIFQSLMRESTISMEGVTHSVASYTSATVIPGPWRDLPRQKDSSPSTLGWISPDTKQGSRSSSSIFSNRWP